MENPLNYLFLRNNAFKLEENNLLANFLYCRNIQFILTIKRTILNTEIAIHSSDKKNLNHRSN